jgi:hypothetical protein
MLSARDITVPSAASPICSVRSTTEPSSSTASPSPAGKNGMHAGDTSHESTHLACACGLSWPASIPPPLPLLARPTLSRCQIQTRCQLQHLAIPGPRASQDFANHPHWPENQQKIPTSVMRRIPSTASAE